MTYKAKTFSPILKEGYYLAATSAGNWHWFSDRPYFKGHYYTWSARSGTTGSADCFTGLPEFPKYAWREHLYQVVGGQLVRVDLEAKINEVSAGEKDSQEVHNVADQQRCENHGLAR